MKKIILVLMFGLGLVSVANAESVCEKQRYEDGSNYCPNCYEINNFASMLDEKSQEKKWEKLLTRYYVGEIKRSSKESLCIFMNTTITDYLKTTLTPQEIERFERFLIKIARYENYENNKDKYLNLLKISKYFNKIEYLYSHYSEMPNYAFDFFVDVVETLTNYNNDIAVSVERFVYDKYVSDVFEWQRQHTDHSLSYMKYKLKEFEKNGNCANQECKDLKYIIQWAESKLKESK